MTWSGLTQWLSDIAYIIPASSHLIITFFTTSFILGFNLHCGCTLGLNSSSNSILCWQYIGLIPRMSAMVHPMAFSCSFNTWTNLSSCSLESSLEMLEVMLKYLKEQDVKAEYEKYLYVKNAMPLSSGKNFKILFNSHSCGHMLLPLYHKYLLWSTQKLTCNALRRVPDTYYTINKHGIFE